MIQHALGIHGLNRAQNFCLLIVNGRRIEGNRGLHGRQADQLENMIGDHVGKRARPIVVIATQFHAKFLRDRNLHVIHVTPIPDRLENAVRKAKSQNVLYGFFSQVMVNAIDLIFLQNLSNFVIQGDGRRQIVSKRFFDHHPPPLPIHFIGQPGIAKLFYDHWKKCGAGGQVEQAIPLRVLLVFHLNQQRFEFLKKFGILKISRQIIESFRKPVPGLAVQRADRVFPSLGRHPRTKLVNRIFFARNTDDCELIGKQFAFGQVV